MLKSALLRVLKLCSLSAKMITNLKKVLLINYDNRSLLYNSFVCLERFLSLKLLMRNVMLLNSVNSPYSIWLLINWLNCLLRKVKSENFVFVKHFSILNCPFCPLPPVLGELPLSSASWWILKTFKNYEALLIKRKAWFMF